MNEQQLRILNNVKIQLQLDETINKDELLALLVKRAINSINLYTGDSVLPETLESICEDVVCAMYRKVGTEGITGETVDTVSYTYAENALAGFYPVLNRYIENRDKISSRVVKFY